MATTLGFLQNDSHSIVDTVNVAFKRRKQLITWPLTADEVIDIHEPHVAKLIHGLKKEYPAALHWDHKAELLIEAEGYIRNQIKIELHSNKPIPLSVDYLANAPKIVVPILCYNGEATAALRDWGWKATQIELENRWAINIIKLLADKATTHQQVHRFMPELYTLLVQQEDAMTDKYPYHSHRLKEVSERLKITGSARAWKIQLPFVTVQHRLALRRLIAQTVMLPMQPEDENTLNFYNSWISL